MAKVAPLQSNFNGGEFSPLVYGRVDTERYRTGLAICLNYIPTLQGGLTRRSGSYFAAGTKTHAKKSRLVRFEFSTTQAYMLEFGDQYIRFYRDYGQIEVAGVAAWVVTTVYAVGDLVANGGVNYYCYVAHTAAAGDEPGVGANWEDYWHALTGAIYEIPTPYLEADLPRLRYVQSADVLYLTHPDYAPRTLSRTGHTAWTLDVMEFSDGPYMAVNDTTTTLTPSAATGTGVTLTASAVTGINEGLGFQTTDVGRLIRIAEGTVWGWVRITGRTSTTVVTVTVESTLTNINAKSFWRMGLWSGTTGYPAVAVFHEDRLIFAGTTEAPSRIDGSRSGDYPNFAGTETDGTVTDSHAVSFTLNSNTVNVIRWMAPDERGLAVGTAGGEWIVRPSLQSEALSPTNISAQQPTAYGSADVAVISAGKSSVFVQRSGRKMRELRYFFQEDGFESPDITVLAEHITKSGIVELARQQDPQPLIWAVRNDGVLACVTFERDLDALRVGWHRHILGGVGDALGGAPIVESVASIPSPDGTRDDLWLIVKRYINGATVRYVEFFEPLFDGQTMVQEAVYLVDSGLSYDGVAASTFGGLTHLEGETLSVLADGAVHPDVIVSAGSVTLNYAASVVHIGYGYNSDGQILRLEAGAQNGVALGKTRRIHRVGMLLHDTLGLSIGMDFDNLDEVTFRTSGDLDGVAVPLFSGIISEEIEAAYDFDNQFCWRQSQPLPGTILAIMPQMDTQDRQ